MVPGADEKTSLFAGSNLGVWHNTEQVDASLDLLEYLSSVEAQLSWFEINGELPAVSAALDDASLQSDPLVAVYSQQLADSKVLPLVPNWDGVTGSDLLAALNAIVLTGADRDATLAELFAKSEGVSIG